MAQSTCTANPRWPSVPRRLVPERPSTPGDAAVPPTVTLGTPADLGGAVSATFTVDSVVYALSLLTNDLQITEQAIMTAEPNPIPTLTERFLYNAKDSLDQYMINVMV